MLFNSPVFLFYFLPAVVCVALLLRTRSTSILPFVSFVSIASLAFYAYSNISWLALIVGSIVANYSIGLLLKSQSSYRRATLAAGITLNLGLLAYFKYADFLIQNSNSLFGTSTPALGILLPIGISFYTFQQIAYLVDVYRDKGIQRRFIEYLFFVSFFPQLIAGPIVHHKQLIPQLALVKQRPVISDLTIGLIWFFAGLSKKVLFADTYGVQANAYFSDPQGGAAAAWAGAIAYSLQIYFDFSGYSDMAIGIGRMFGLSLPINFDSPYKARSIVDFWRRWHITLSSFLKAYLYIPLGGNRKGTSRRYINLFLTMLLGGLWHGAGWGFVLWGGLHGLYLCINHAASNWSKPKWLRLLGWPLTLFAVAFAWIPFRTGDMSSTLEIWTQMLSLAQPGNANLVNESMLLYLIAGCAIALGAPNTQEICERLFESPNGASDWSSESPRQTQSKTTLPSYVRPTVAAIAGFAAALGLALNNRIAEFLYFQF